MFKKFFHIKTIMWMNVFLLHIFCIVYIYQGPTHKHFVGSEKHQLKDIISPHLLPGGNRTWVLFCEPEADSSSDHQAL